MNRLRLIAAAVSCGSALAATPTPPNAVSLVEHTASRETQAAAPSGAQASSQTVPSGPTFVLKEVAVKVNNTITTEELSTPSHWRIGTTVGFTLKQTAPRETPPALPSGAQASLPAAPHGVPPLGTTPGPTFVLKGVKVKGNNRIATEELLSPTRGKIGTAVSMADLQSIAARIMQVYRDRGYLLAQVVIPPQDVTSGNVEFEVIEGRDTATNLRDAETIVSMSMERCLLDGYCSPSVDAAEDGRSRNTIEADTLAKEVAQQTGNASMAVLVKRDLAIAYSYGIDIDIAERYAREAIASGAKAPDQVLAPAHKVLGDIAVRLGNLAAAITEYRAALQTTSARYRPMVLLSMTTAQIAAGDLVAARATFDQAGAAQGALRPPLYKRVEGNLLLAEGKPQAALVAFSAGVTNGAPGEASYQNLWAHEGMGRAYLALGDRAQALAAWFKALDDSETVRARFRSDEFKIGVFASSQTVFENAIGLVIERGDYELAWTLSERSRGRALLDDVSNQQAAGADAQQPLSSRTLSLDEVRQSLRSNEAIVEFHSLPEQTIVWVIRRDGLDGHTLPITRAAMNAVITDFRAAFVGGGAADDRRAIARHRPTVNTYCTKLDALLIKPLRLRPDERLIIVPYGNLHYFPFQLLKDDQGFLIQRHPIALALSASIAVQYVHRQQRIPSDLVAFGNPSISPRYDLPGAELEVRGIAPLFAASRIFLRSTATRAAFMDNAPAAHILHIATHSLADRVDPPHSPMLFAPASQPADGPDMLLARDIFDMNLKHVALVTLSGSETGLGRVARGEEILGFTRAFFHAGASALIVSMWQVSDESTELTMRTFYGSLTRGQEAIDAMRSAQLAVLANSKFARPFFWAPFDLMGNWRLVVVQ